MKIHLEYLYGGFAFTVLAISLSVLDKGLFSVSEYTGSDAFYSQILPFLNNFDFSELQLLQYAHFIRFVVVYPFVFGELNNLGGVYFAVVFLLVSFPILKAVNKGKFCFIKYIILFIPIFVSFRTFLVACAIAYLFIAIYHHKSNFLLFLSLLGSILSSGVVLIWILVCLINFRVLRKKYRTFAYFLFAGMLLVFFPSILHKHEYAAEALGGYSDYFMRGALVESILKGWWSRVVVYCVCLSAMVMILIHSFFVKGFKHFYLSYTPFLIGVIFEGLGFISVLIVLIMFYAGFRPNWKYNNVR